MTVVGPEGQGGEDSSSIESGGSLAHELEEQLEQQNREAAERAALQKTISGAAVEVARIGDLIDKRVDEYAASFDIKRERSADEVKAHEDYIAGLYAQQREVGNAALGAAAQLLGGPMELPKEETARASRKRLPFLPGRKGNEDVYTGRTDAQREEYDAEMLARKQLLALRDIAKDPHIDETADGRARLLVAETALWAADGADPRYPPRGYEAPSETSGPPAEPSATTETGPLPEPVSEQAQHEAPMGAEAAPGAPVPPENIRDVIIPTPEELAADPERLVILNDLVRGPVEDWRMPVNMRRTALRDVITAAREIVAAREGQPAAPGQPKAPEPPEPRQAAAVVPNQPAPPPELVNLPVQPVQPTQPVNPVQPAAPAGARHRAGAKHRKADQASTTSTPVKPGPAHREVKPDPKEEWRKAWKPTDEEREAQIRDIETRAQAEAERLAKGTRLDQRRQKRSEAEEAKKKAEEDKKKLEVTAENKRWRRLWDPTDEEIEADRVAALPQPAPVAAEMPPAHAHHDEAQRWEDMQIRHAAEQPERDARSYEKGSPTALEDAAWVQVQAEEQRAIEEARSLAAANEKATAANMAAMAAEATQAAGYSPHKQELGRAVTAAERGDNRTISLEQAAELLNYSDVYLSDPSQTSQRAEAVKSLLESGEGAKYAHTLQELVAEHGEARILNMAASIRQSTADILAANTDQTFKQSEIFESNSWAVWELAKQKYLSEHPGESTDKYVLGDPFENTEEAAEIRGDIALRQAGWEISVASGLDRKELPPSVQKLLKLTAERKLASHELVTLGLEWMDPTPPTPVTPTVEPVHVPSRFAVGPDGTAEDINTPPTPDAPALKADNAPALTRAEQVLEHAKSRVDGLGVPPSGLPTDVQMDHYIQSANSTEDLGAMRQWIVDRAAEERRDLKDPSTANLLRVENREKAFLQRLKKRGVTIRSQGRVRAEGARLLDQDDATIEGQDIPRKANAGPTSPYMTERYDDDVRRAVDRQKAQRRVARNVGPAAPDGAGAPAEVKTLDEVGAPDAIGTPDAPGTPEATAATGKYGAELAALGEITDRAAYEAARDGLIAQALADGYVVRDAPARLGIRRGPDDDSVVFIHELMEGKQPDGETKVSERAKPEEQTAIEPEVAQREKLVNDIKVLAARTDIDEAAKQGELAYLLRDALDQKLVKRHATAHLGVASTGKPESREFVAQLRAVFPKDRPTAPAITPDSLPDEVPATPPDESVDVSPEQPVIEDEADSSSENGEGGGDADDGGGDNGEAIASSDAPVQVEAPAETVEQPAVGPKSVETSQREALATILPKLAAARSRKDLYAVANEAARAGLVAANRAGAGKEALNPWQIVAPLDTSESGHFYDELREFDADIMSAMALGRYLEKIQAEPESELARVKAAYTPKAARAQDFDWTQQAVEEVLATRPTELTREQLARQLIATGHLVVSDAPQGEKSLEFAGDEVWVDAQVIDEKTKNKDEVGKFALSKLRIPGAPNGPRRRAALQKQAAAAEAAARVEAPAPVEPAEQFEPAEEPAEVPTVEAAEEPAIEAESAQVPEAADAIPEGDIEAAPSLSDAELIARGSAIANEVRNAYFDRTPGLDDDAWRNQLEDKLSLAADPSVNLARFTTDENDPFGVEETDTPGSAEFVAALREILAEQVAEPEQPETEVGQTVEAEGQVAEYDEDYLTDDITDKRGQRDENRARRRASERNFDPRPQGEE